MLPKRPIQDYRIGWICALHIELQAATTLLDERHECHPGKANDPNNYTLGCIRGHNIVMACLPDNSQGTNAAATVASHMRSTFTSIEFGLMVGIGGGVPSRDSDIRLGDVVVGHHVIQFDFGKNEASGFRQTGHLNGPPTALLTTVATLRAHPSEHYESFLHNIEIIGQKFKEFRRAEAGPDFLFEASYNHVDGEYCENCDKAKEMQRTERLDTEIKIHYGTIVSGNQVMKNGKTRDQLSKDLKRVLCFEMEAAGLMNTLPCLVVRGICDYADSHKNKRWQPYAAAAAAAYAKVLLSFLSVAEASEQHATSTAEKHSADSMELWKVEIQAKLAWIASEFDVKSNWRTSVVDLLKLLGRNNDLDNLDRLAGTLGVNRDQRGISETALHDAVMKELAEGEDQWERIIGNWQLRLCCFNCGSSSHFEDNCERKCGKCMTFYLFVVVQFC